MSARPDVRLGIVTYGTPDDLDACLQTVPAALSGLQAEVVVVDNGSPTDADADVARRHDVRLLRIVDNVGYPRAMNRAMMGATAPVLAMVNPDALLRPGSLEHLVRTVLDDATVGLVGPRVTGPDGHLQHSIRRFPSPAAALTTGLVPPALRKHLPGQPYWLEDHPEPEQPVDVDWLVGAVHVLRRNALGREKVYSERSFMYAEDMELCGHVLERGYRVVYDPRAEAQHIGNVTGDREFGGRREMRWLDATYDWYVDTRGASAARGYAAANVAGLAAKRAVLAVRGSEQHRRVVASLLSFHARRVLQPLGDQHSRAAPDGRVPAPPVVVEDRAGEA